MKKFLCSLLIFLLCINCLNMLAFCDGDNIIPASESTMDGASAWSSRYGGKISYIKKELRNDSENICLKFDRDGEGSWVSPILDIISYLKTDVQKNGESYYNIELDFQIVDTSTNNINTNCLMRTNKSTSFAQTANSDETEYRSSLGRISDLVSESWYHYESSFLCTEDDIESTKFAYFCFDSLVSTVTELYIDNFEITRLSEKPEDLGQGLCTEIGSYAISKPAVIDVPAIIDDGSIDVEYNVVGGNLLSSENSEFEIGDISKCSWNKMGSASISLSDSGFYGKCLYATSIENSWSSPTLNIAPYINTPGTYAFGMYVKFDFPDSNKHDISLLVRGEFENSFIEKHGGNYFLTAVKNYKCQGDMWTYLSFDVEVTQDDISAKTAKTEWNIALSGMPDKTSGIYIDNVELIFGETSELEKTSDSELSEKNSEATKALVESRSENVSEMHLDKSFYEAVIYSAVFTFVVTATVIFIKIKKYGKAKK